MTAHVVYTAVDPDRPATLSRRVVAEVIRDAIGFDGLLISDDLAMKALGGPFEERARAAFAAGVDVVLHCNGDPAEAWAVATASPWLDDRPAARAQAALTQRQGGATVFDPVDAARRLASVLEGTG